MTYYKFMKKGCIGSFSGKKLEPDKWLPPIEGDLVICKNGYHGCDAEHLAEWVDEELYTLETRGDSLHDNRKDCFREIKMTRVEAWTKDTLILWTADCAERVLPVWEKEYPGDGRVRHCIETTRAFVEGKATEKELAAAGAAAWDTDWAARAAALAARAAAWAARAVAGAWAAWDTWATWAARDAAWAAAWADAAAAERKWQSERILYYVNKGE